MTKDSFILVLFLASSLLIFSLLVDSESFRISLPSLAGRNDGNQDESNTLGEDERSLTFAFDDYHVLFPGCALQPPKQLDIDDMELLPETAQTETYPSRAITNLKTRTHVVYRPHSREAYERSRSRSMLAQESEALEWDRLEVLGPDVEDRHTLQQLARMAGNAYSLPGKRTYELDEAWNVSFPFGWEDLQDGFRGHVFVSSDKSTVVLAIKGTTLQGVTSKKDRFNDNLLFSCCCARVDITWMFATVCDCYSDQWRCDDSCLSEALIEDSLFYSVGVHLFNNLTDLFPDANIWLTGHSLGGALASLLGTTFGVPAVAFESPGERLAANRLHLPTHLASAVIHVYNNADPVAQGVCTGVCSLCAQAGFAIETRCHLGKSIIYDTVGMYGWRVDVRRHVIREMILNVLQDERDWEEGRAVPLAREEDDCIDCYKWEFGGFKGHSFENGQL